MGLPEQVDVVIIGGGVMGASALYHLAARGQSSVLLLEKEAFFGAGATGRCAGGVRYQFATEINIRLSLESLPMLARFEEEIGHPVDYRQTGYLFLLTTEQDVQRFRRNVALQHRLGVQTEWLDGAAVRRRLPLMALDDVLAGTLHPAEGLVDPNGVVMGYIGAARRLGARAESEAAVTGLHVTNGRIRAVETTRGRVAAAQVLNAAGPWAGRVAQMAGVEVPITPLRRQMFTTTPLPAVTAEFPFVVDFARSLYFHREGEGLLIGMSNPAEMPGFDQRVDSEWELQTMAAAAARLPLLDRAGVTARWAGLYEVTPDAHPILGETDVAGFYICGGFSGHGFMHGPIAGKLMSEILLDGAAATVDVSQLDLARFADGRLIHEYNVI